MKKIISILTLTLFAFCITNAQEIIRTLKTNTWEKTLEKDVVYFLQPNNNSIEIKQGETYLHFLTMPDSLIFDSTMDDGIIINGLKWATRNVDAPGTFVSQPYEAGMFYQWNRNIGWSSTNPLVNHQGGTTWDSSFSNSSTFSNSPCPNGWRLPTQVEFESLVGSGNYWGDLNSVPGRFFGNGEHKVFFPAVGYRNCNGILYSVGTIGRYWSATHEFNNSAYGMSFSSGSVNPKFGLDKCEGHSVRCVKD
jgi:uncharacterized protein (TIGR02145 family)